MSIWTFIEVIIAAFFMGIGALKFRVAANHGIGHAVVGAVCVGVAAWAGWAAYSNLAG